VEAEMTTQLKLMISLMLVISTLTGPTAYGVEKAYVDCDGRSNVPFYATPWGNTPLGNLNCGQEVEVMTKQTVYTKITVEQQAGYVLSHFLRDTATPNAQAEASPQVSATNAHNNPASIKKSSGAFWKKLAVGLAAGALITASAYAAASDSSYTPPAVYTPPSAYHQAHTNSNSLTYPSISGSNGVSSSETFQRIGGTTFYSGAISGTSQRIGNTTFHNLYGDNGTTLSGTSQKVGNLTFDNFSDSNGVTSSGTSQRIGNLTFFNSSNSNGTTSTGTSQRIGNFSFYNSTDSNGNQINGTAQRIGNFTFYNFSESKR
jgi:hypothetical protein